MRSIRAICLAIAIAVPAMGGHSVLAGPQDDEAALKRLFETEAAQADWFTEAFRAQVPPLQVRAIVADLEQRYGGLKDVESRSGGYSLILERARVPARIALDADGRIAGLFFEPPVPAGTLETQLDAIAALPGETAYLVTADGETVSARNADMPLAVGSAFKLAVLKAVYDAVDRGHLSWDKVVRLKPEWRSQPSGMLQDWPVGTPVTVATLAGLMISRSDNTAADALIHLTGRDEIESVSPRNAPFLTTREAFTLKASGNADLRQRWLAADEAGRRALLDVIAALPLPDASGLETQPTSRIEWFFTAREICALLEKTRALPAFSINPGPVDHDAWRHIAYKGGSEAGVLNLSALVAGAEGRSHCAVATWNAPRPLDEQKLLAPFRGILESLATH